MSNRWSETVLCNFILTSSMWKPHWQTYLYWLAWFCLASCVLVHAQDKRCFTYKNIWWKIFLRRRMWTRDLWLPRVVNIPPSIDEDCSRHRTPWWWFVSSSYIFVDQLSIKCNIRLKYLRSVLKLASAIMYLFYIQYIYAAAFNVKKTMLVVSTYLVPH